MNDKIFLDTNVLIYLYDRDVAKKEIAKKLLGSHYIISTQVLNEFSNTSLRKLHIPVDELKVILSVLIAHTQLVTFDDKTILQALEVKQRYGFSYYDSMILATALENNCTIVYSEDMHHGQMIFDQLRIVNPF